MQGRFEIRGSVMSEHSVGANAGERSGGVRPTWVPTRIEVALWLSGVVAGIVAALYSFARVPSWWLAIFVFVVISHTIGRGLSEVITKPYRLAHAVYYALFPVVGTAILVIAYDLWGEMWLAAVLGLVLGGVLQVALGSALLPERASTRVIKDVPTEEKDERRIATHADSSVEQCDGQGPYDAASKQADQLQEGKEESWRQMC